MVCLATTWGYKATVTVHVTCKQPQHANEGNKPKVTSLLIIHGHANTTCK